MYEKGYVRFGVNELRCLRQRQHKNNQLKRVVADLTPDKHMQTEALRRGV